MQQNDIIVMHNKRTLMSENGSRIKLVHSTDKLTGRDKIGQNSTRTKWYTNNMVFKQHDTRTEWYG